MATKIKLTKKQSALVAIGLAALTTGIVLVVKTSKKKKALQAGNS